MGLCIYEGILWDFECGKIKAKRCNVEKRKLKCAV